jgi:hypothetical protein
VLGKYTNAWYTANAINMFENEIKVKFVVQTRVDDSILLSSEESSQHAHKLLVG